MTISKNGVITYDNYSVRGFNVLLLTIHSGSWVPVEIAGRFRISKKKMRMEEDIGTDRLYREIVLDKGGIWIDNKQSRFVIDFNRPIEKAIYSDNSEPWVAEVWKTPPAKKEIETIRKSYIDFHFTLAQLIDTYHFNIVLDAHSMNNAPGRPGISFGIEFIPRFYMPIVKHMKESLEKKGYGKVRFNIPYKGGYILQSLMAKFPNAFTCSVEVNKKLYLKKDSLRPDGKRLGRLKKDIYSLFDLPK
jgi:N-formylglutamate amidohydrolase